MLIAKPIIVEGPMNLWVVKNGRHFSGSQGGYLYRLRRGMWAIAYENANNPTEPQYNPLYPKHVLARGTVVKHYGDACTLFRERFPLDKLPE